MKNKILSIDNWINNKYKYNYKYKYNIIKMNK